jgi:hypothetical protein
MCRASEHFSRMIRISAKLLQRQENLQTEQRFRLRDIIRSVRAYLLQEAFQQLRNYNSAT